MLKPGAGNGIGELLRYLRDRDHLTQGQVAERTGLSISYLSDIERGRTTPSMEAIARLADAFGLTLLEFIGSAEMHLTAAERALLVAYRARDLNTIVRLLQPLSESEPKS